MGTSIIITVLIALLAAAGWVAYAGWALHGDVDIPLTAYVAMGLGIVLSLIVGIGLMALVFYSHRKGYDEAGHWPSDHHGP